MINAATGVYYTVTASATTFASAAVGDDIYKKSGNNYEKVTGGVTQAMLDAVNNQYYSAVGTHTNDTFWDSATADSTSIYSDTSASSASQLTVTQAMIDAYKNATTPVYYSLSVSVKTSFTVGDEIYTNETNGDYNKVGGDATAEMKNAAEAKYYTVSGVITKPAFWKTTSAGAAIYTRTGSSDNDYVYAPVTGGVIAEMINAGTGMYVMESDGTDTAVAWDTVSTSSEVYLKELGTAISAADLVMNYYKNTAASSGEDAFGTYEKVLLEIVQQGTATGTSKGTYEPSGTTFTVPLSSFTTGTYMATFKAYVPSSNNKKPYEYTVYLQIND